jgi:peptide deformylase
MTKIKTSILDYKEAPVLREMAKLVPLKEIGGKKLENILNRMKEALHEQEDGVAIAAPQIGESLRIFVVSGKAVDMYRGEDKKLHTKKGAELRKDTIFINPEIIKLSKNKKFMEEGCLSVRWQYGKVKRSEKATIHAYNEFGKKFEIGGAGLMAQIFQHETDHLDGILFIDKAKDLAELPPNQDDSKEN